jgi:hypothetical protein
MKTLREMIDLIESVQTEAETDKNQSGLQALQATMDFAQQHGYRIKRSPAGKKARFVNKQIDHQIDTEVYVDKQDGDIWVNFDDSMGPSGNDPATEFYDYFVDSYKNAVRYHQQWSRNINEQLK